MALLSEFEFDKENKGKENKLEDALSRHAMLLWKFMLVVQLHILQR